jgi:pimeloyl-ACP methyl ester carboxylesterase
MAATVDAPLSEKAMSTAEPLSQETLVSTVPDGQLTAENLSFEAGDVSFAYRRFGNRQTIAPALVMLQHFRGNLDSWDPALVGRLAQDREVILLDNRGVGGSAGVVPESVTSMARDALAFIDALGLKQIDLLGFSLEGYVAQELVLLRPRLVRRLVLAGTAPQGGPGLHRWSGDAYALATPDQPTAGGLLGLFFTGSEHSRAKGMESIGRLYPREAGRDGPTDLATRDAELAAITGWGIPDESKHQPPCRHYATDARGQWRQRNDDAHPKLPPAGITSPERPAADLLGRRPRIPEPVPGAGRRRRRRLSQDVMTSTHTTVVREPASQGLVEATATPPFCPN